jgi:hypothetical protein
MGRKPKRPRRAGKSKAARLEKSFVSPSAEPDTVCMPIDTASVGGDLTGEERADFSPGEKAFNGHAFPSADNHLEPIPQVEDAELPGVEHDLVLSAPPNESRRCLGVVTSVSIGRNDLPLADSDWAGILSGEDEA